MILAFILFALLGVTEFAAIFTDAQWGDIQSFLNFCVLLFIAVRHERSARKAVSAVEQAHSAVEQAPERAAEQTAQRVHDDITDPGGLRDELIEIIVDAMEKRARRYPQR